MAGIPDPPDDLVPRGRGRRFWRQVFKEFDPNPREVELVAEAARLMDHLDAVRVQLRDAPLVVDGRTHPLVVERRLALSELRLLLGSIGWGDEVDPLRRGRARKAAATRWGL